MDPKAMDTVPLMSEGRLDKEVDIVSMVRIRVNIIARKISLPDVKKELESTKVQVRRTDTIEGIVANIRAENNVDDEAAECGLHAVYHSAKFVQGGITIRGNQTAALLFEDRHSNVADAEVNFVYTYPPPMTCDVTINAFLVVEEEGRPNIQQSLAPPYVMRLNCNTAISEIMQRVRSENDVDGKASGLGSGEPVTFRKIECHKGRGYQEKMHANPSEAVKAYFPDLYTPYVSFNVYLYYTKSPSSCCTVM